ncbi:MAG: alpha/beta hydrolase [Povalibacter sp.]
MTSIKFVSQNFLGTFWLFILLALTSGCVNAPSERMPEQVGPLQKLSIPVDGHTFALWTRQIAHPKGSILLLHGRTWSALPDFDLKVPGEQRSVMVALNRQGYTTYALDMRGYGSTPRDESGWLTPDRAAADLAGVLQWIIGREHRKPTLVGWSYGSLVAHLTAQQHPESIGNLVLYGYPRDPAVTTQPAATADTPPREVNTRERAASDFISPDVTPHSVIDSYVEAALTADPVRVDWCNLEQFNALEPGKIVTPTLLIHGERDPLTPAAAQARVFTGLGNADKQWIVLAGADHAALIEDTLPGFVAAIVSFVERPAPRRDAR